MLLLGTLGLAGCQNATTQQNPYVLPQFSLAQPGAGPIDNVQAAASTSSALEGSTAQGNADAPVADAEQAVAVVLPDRVPVPKRRSNPFRVAGESVEAETVRIASLDPSSGVTPPPVPGLPGVTVPTIRSEVTPADEAVGPVRESRRRVATLVRKGNSKYAIRRAQFAPLVEKAARKHGVPVKLALAVVHVESSFRPQAKGSAGEIGLMQVMPSTARYMGYKGPMRKLYNPETNIDVGMRYLAKAHRLGGGKLCGTILKYNAGHGAKRMNPVSRKYCERVRKLMQDA